MRNRRKQVYDSPSLYLLATWQGQADHAMHSSQRFKAYLLHSGMKNADAQTNSGGSVSASRVYDAFGAELSSTGSWQGRFGYAGGFGYQEDDGGFKLLGHRYYDPSTGRFLTRDPAKDGKNWYAYCESQPISSQDSSGLFPTTGLLLANEAMLAAEFGDLGPGNRPLPDPTMFNAMQMKQLGDVMNPKHPVDMAYMLWRYRELVKDGGPWDFKKDNPMHQDYGNYHYGVTGYLLFRDEEFLLRKAGENQIANKRSRPEWQPADGGPPYGDDPRDQIWIRRGVQFGRAFEAAY